MNEKIIEHLACPISNERLEFDRINNRLISPKTKLAFPIQNGIPVLLPEAGVPIEENN
ncbi:hypothetical protein EV693_10671 [Nicoletella semolina]|uniref:UPF0434 protein EV693_10671 n=1 Tax=Nicoletella semolina TaxID=271160 RepID=A0A4R2N8R8_9PAST|nr:Trm112 family protein [Nicoletella semolina]MDH2924485.1 tetraacyldisaccharide 4'-kinase [Nicoletella semolina]TCP17387.1 hypothetical protein EV693_10671 [Nicoletella semolina]